MTCGGCGAAPRESHRLIVERAWARARAAMTTVKVRRVGGLAVVDLPDGPSGVRHGDVVEVVDRERADRMVSTGEWELVTGSDKQGSEGSGGA